MYKIVLVRWKDAVTAPRWMRNDEVEGFAKSGIRDMETVGFLVKESDEELIICGTRQIQGEEVGTVTVIPKPADIVPLSELIEGGSAWIKGDDRKEE